MAHARSISWRRSPAIGRPGLLRRSARLRPRRFILIGGTSGRVQLGLLRSRLRLSRGMARSYERHIRCVSWTGVQETLSFPPVTLQVPERCS